MNMNRRQELCRNFQRGSCKYGAQCRFVHASSQQQQQQPKSNQFGFGTGSGQQQQQQQSNSNPFGFGTGNRQQQHQQQPNSNPFGFGTGSRQQQQQPSFGTQFQQQQQQKPNPFGFGVQGGSAQSRNVPGQAKTFQNKWVRDQSAPTKQSETAQPPPAAHISCTDPASCRQQIVDDFKNETPLWKLTCYAHLRSGPCDIKGDLSFEELRAQAYEEGRQGNPLQSIIERERNLQNAKLMEFTNFLNNPHVSQTPSFPTVASVPEVKSNSFGVSQSNGPPVFTSFSQIGTSSNVGPGTRTMTGVPTNTLFGQSSQISNQAFPTPSFGGSEMKFGVSGPFGSQTRQPSGSLQGSSMSSFGFPKPSSAGYQQSPASSIQHRDIDKQSLDLLGGMMAPTSAINETPVEDDKNESQDNSIWLKEKWSIGEIPLSEPPKRHISHVF